MAATDGPDLAAVAEASGLDVAAFVARHSGAVLKVLAIGFAPGFAYCGFHDDLKRLPRRGEVRPRMPAGSILYAAGQTALTATPIPTGWHVIGRTTFANFDPGATPPVASEAGRPRPVRAAMRAKARLRILRAAPLTTVQDAGRFGALGYGIAASGPMDVFGWASAGGGRSGIEFTRAGLEFELVSGAVTASFSGERFHLRVNGERLVWPDRVELKNG